MAAQCGGRHFGRRGSAASGGRLNSNLGEGEFSLKMTREHDGVGLNASILPSKLSRE